MKTQFGFTQFTIQEFENYIKALKVGRTVLYIQEHHTFSPDYQLCETHTPFELQRGMRNYHMSQGWKDIGQHFTTFPDGTILTGRSIEESPACIVGFNSHAICIENLGNFDAGKDVMSAAQKETIVKMTAILATKFNIPIDTDRIVYHHWFNLSTGERNNGTKNNKSCPGTAFFGGNKVADCQANFIPLVKNEAAGAVQPRPITLLEYRIVTADQLNVRTAATASAPKAADRTSILLGGVVRVFEEKEGWYKISSSASHWIAGKFTQKVIRATVNTDTLNVRSGAGANFAKVGSLTKGTEVFISEESNGWSKIGLETKWVKTSYLNK